MRYMTCQYFLPLIRLLLILSMVSFPLQKLFSVLGSHLLNSELLKVWEFSTTSGCQSSTDQPETWYILPQFCKTLLPWYMVNPQ